MSWMNDPHYKSSKIYILWRKQRQNNKPFWCRLTCIGKTQNTMEYIGVEIKGCKSWKICDSMFLAQNYQVLSQWCTCNSKFIIKSCPNDPLLAHNYQVLLVKSLSLTLLIFHGTTLFFLTSFSFLIFTVQILHSFPFLSSHFLVSPIFFLIKFYSQFNDPSYFS